MEIKEGKLKKLDGMWSVEYPAEPQDMYTWYNRIPLDDILCSTTQSADETLAKWFNVPIDKLDGLAVKWDNKTAKWKLKKNG